jgi:Tfp pilus assembly protein PilV
MILSKGKNKTRTKLPGNKGFLLVEVLVVASIMVAGALAFSAVAQKSIYVARESMSATRANFLLEEGAEAVRVLRDNGWSNISGLSTGTDYYPTFSGGTWTLSATPNTVGAFTRKVTIANVNRDNTTQDISASGSNDAGTKLVTVTVSWSEEANTITKNLSFYIMNIF